MGKLDDLRQSLTDMDSEQLLAKVRQIRDERRVRTEKPAAVKQKKVESSKKLTALARALKDMSPEELRALLED